jgi:hypothetical protein
LRSIAEILRELVAIGDGTASAQSIHLIIGGGWGIVREEETEMKRAAMKQRWESNIVNGNRKFQVLDVGSTIGTFTYLYTWEKNIITRAGTVLPSVKSTLQYDFTSENFIGKIRSMPRHFFHVIARLKSPTRINHKPYS